MSRKKKRSVKVPAFVQTLSRTPEDAWPHGALHHGARIALPVLLALGIALLFPAEGPRTDTPTFQEGTVAPREVTAEVGFPIPKPEETLETERAEAAASVPPVFDYDGEARDRMGARLEGFFIAVQEALDTGGRPALEEVLARAPLNLTEETQVQQFLNPQTLADLRQAAADVARELVPQFLELADAEGVTEAGRMEVRNEAGESVYLPSDSLIWGREVFPLAFEYLDSGTPDLETVFQVILLSFMESPYVLNNTATNIAKNRMRQAVQLTAGEVAEGQVLVRRGDRIGPEQAHLLRAYREVMAQQGRSRDRGLDWRSLGGAFLLNLLLLGVYGLLIFFFRGEVYGNYRWVLLQSILVAVYFVGVRGVVGQGWPPELFPIAFAILPVAVIWDGRMALVLALILGVLTFVQPSANEFFILIMTLVGGAAAALSARAIRRRSQVWIFIALITLGYFLAISALGLLDRSGPLSIPWAVTLAALNTTVAAILAVGFMPVFEWFTGITTDQTLLEWADPNRPLLKRLSMEAGGTYAHTINVANLAESAATAIGANGLLTRVGIYYHDVGKILKPQYFVENQPGGRNPHDKLKPHMSAAIVREHVVEGDRMAREEGVPDVVARFIPEHHGTQLIGFFYEKAKEESDGELNAEEFRYPGPKPQSKETAIAMLADSVESATRALQDPSPDRVGELVRTIVEGKIRDGQLSESPLTLGEISLIQEQFVKVVGGMYHQRIDYPATRHITEAPDGEEDAEPRAEGTHPAEEAPEGT